MTDITTIFLSAGVIKGLLLLLPTHLMPDDDFEEWLNDDGFSDVVKKDGNKKFLFIELDKLKNKFRSDMMDVSVIEDGKGHPLSPLGVYNLVQGHKNRISKVRLMIEHEISIAHNLHKPSGVRYVVARSYWINNQGKKVRKFAKNIGADDKVLVKGKIPPHKLIEVEKEIDTMMWEQYKSEYKF